MRNCIRKFFNKRDDFLQKDARYSRLSSYLEKQFSALRAADLLTEDEFCVLNASLSDISTESFNTFAWNSQIQRFLEEYWNPELKIQREKEETEKQNEIEDSGIRFSFSISPPDWYIGITSDFTKSISKIDKKFQGRILEAIAYIATNPMTPNGNTVKPLSGEMGSMWRYRIGDYRIIYHPDKKSKLILLLSFSPRGSAYH